MAKFTIPCLVGRTNKAGITSWYWQPSKTLRAAKWQPVALGKDETAAIAAARALNEQVERWKSGGKIDGPLRTTVAKRESAGTLRALIGRYRREVIDGKKPDGSPRLKPKTRAVYETSLPRLDAWAGKHPIAYITPARVRALRDATAKPVEAGGIGHSAAFALLRVLRQVMAFAEKIDMIPKGSNPATNFDLAGPAPRSTIWTADDEAAFIAAAYDLGRPGMALAIELALYTAQREGDLIAFTEAQLVELDIFDLRLREILAGKDGTVRGWSMEQAKMTTTHSARCMEIPLEPKLAERVQAAIRTNRARDRAATPPRLMTHVLVNDSTGLPWKQRHFIEIWTKIRDHAATRTGRPQMKNLHWHDLRRTRVVRLRRRGMPKEMIASITGHDPKSIDEMLKIYGPIDPTITAAAIASSLEVHTLPEKKEEQADA